MAGALDRRSAPPEYRAAQLKAREAAGALGARGLRDVHKAMQEFADDLARQIAKLDPSKVSQLVALQASRKIILQTAADLENKLAKIVRQHRAASFEEVQDIWRDAGLRAAKLVGIPNSMLGGVLTPGVTLAGAYEALGGAGKTWRTLITSHASAAAREADDLIRTALVTQMSPADLAGGLRGYVTALSPSVKDAWKGATTEQLKALEESARLSRSGLKTARQNASRVAFSEIHNARAEAEVQHFAADPMVDAVIWRLSPFRGSQGEPDMCDVYANTDMYGLGAGVYPIGSVPLPPHPYDRCERVPRVRRWTEAGEPKPNPKRIWNPKTSGINLKSICLLD